MAQESLFARVGLAGNGTRQRMLELIVSRFLPILGSLLVILLAMKLTNFYYKHAWVSAHIATIAHSFASHGIIALRGIPIENFDPITTEPDTYLHWPPFFYYVLSIVLRLFPDSIRAMHLFMATIAIATALALWGAASMFLKPRAAIVCGSAFLLMPATLRYGLVLVPANLAILEVAIALLFVLRYLRGDEAGCAKSRDLGVSAFAYFLACVTTWEPFLVLPGLLLSYSFNRRSAVLKACSCWAVAAVAAAGSILALYSLSDPTFLRDLWSIFTFRVGLTQYFPLPTRIHPVEGFSVTMRGGNIFTPFIFLRDYIVRTQEFFGSLGIIGVIVLLMTTFGQPRVIFNNLLGTIVLALTAFWLFWAVLLQNHYIVHEYQVILATPLLAIAIACLYSLLEEIHRATQDTRLRGNLAVLSNLALPAALLLLGISAAWVTAYGEQEPASRELASLGRLIKINVPEGAIVITDEASMVPTYYAERHVIRGVPNAAYLESHLEMIRGLCRECPLFLALGRGSALEFQDTLLHTKSVFADDRFIINRLN